MVNVAEKLLLKDYGFEPDPVDYDVRNGISDAMYVARTEFLNDLRNHLSSRSEGQQTGGVTTVLYGSAGVGKTHTITWILNWINNKEDPLTIKGKTVIPISLDAPNTKRDSNFSIIYSAIMKGIGKEKVLGLIKKYWIKARGEFPI